MSDILEPIIPDDELSSNKRPREETEGDDGVSDLFDQDDLFGEEPETIEYNGITIPKDSELLNDKKGVSYLKINELSDNDILLLKANLSALPLPIGNAHSKLSVRVQFLINSLPLLENINNQILRLIAITSYEETLTIITNEESSPKGLIFRELVEIFETVKKLYSEEEPFLKITQVFLNPDFEDVQAVEENKNILANIREHHENIDQVFKKTNLTTFLLATLGSIEVGFFYLNESFLDVFCPLEYNFNDWIKAANSDTPVSVLNSSNGLITSSGKILKAQAALYLELKTQAYISALESGTKSKEEILQDIFPDDLEDFILKRRNSNALSPVEIEFLKKCKSRYDTLLNATDETELSESFEWLIFLKELFNYVSRHIIVLVFGRKSARYLPSNDLEALFSSKYSSLSKKELQEKLAETQARQQQFDTHNQATMDIAPDIDPLDPTTDPALLAASATAISSMNEPIVESSKSKADVTGPPRIRNILRRPWLPAEEAVLSEALQVIGPHWSKILEAYGPGGSKNEVLKNRTQVQLKDKARNWKMAYLKNGQPVPDYLAKVTGEKERTDKAKSARTNKRQKLQKAKAEEIEKMKALQLRRAITNETDKNTQSKETTPEAEVLPTDNNSNLDVSSSISEAAVAAASSSNGETGETEAETQAAPAETEAEVEVEVKVGDAADKE
ncbi:hypothetical protein WICPIJ_004626 [Wickerhamomyces pijperi]|uniref:HTH myb-type domain-containing protein n=1 Tax=Wickerhamomyces pijperi TaxID=599730 RepID=A0A9P8Q5H3_WICPI|nr:hypothetical protein WICPIJ_004626 [Wickerhamomyces pijperi]